MIEPTEHQRKLTIDLFNSFTGDEGQTPENLDDAWISALSCLGDTKDEYVIDRLVHAALTTGIVYGQKQQNFSWITTLEQFKRLKKGYRQAVIKRFTKIHETL